MLTMGWRLFLAVITIQTADLVVERDGKMAALKKQVDAVENMQKCAICLDRRRVCCTY